MFAEEPPTDGEVRIHRVICPIEMPDEPFVSGLCSCSWSLSTGLPCRHAVRVGTLYTAGEVSGLPEHVSLPSKYPLHAMFHPYWRKDGEGWQEVEIVALRQGDGGDAAGEGEEKDQYCEDGEQDLAKTARTARLSSRYFCNGRAAWNKVHLCIVSKGITAMKKMDRRMQLLCREVNRNTETEDVDIVGVVRSVAATLEAEQGDSREPRDVSLEEAAALGISNSNQGGVKGRGTKKRAQSWTEKRGKKRGKGGAEKGDQGNLPATQDNLPAAQPTTQPATQSASQPASTQQHSTAVVPVQSPAMMGPLWQLPYYDTQNGTQ